MDIQQFRTVVLPSDIDRGAPVVVRRDRMVEAPVERVWALHLDVAHWPAWQHDVTSAAVRGPLAVGGSFAWTTAGLDTPLVSNSQ